MKPHDDEAEYRLQFLVAFFEDLHPALTELPIPSDKEFEKFYVHLLREVCLAYRGRVVAGLVDPSLSQGDESEPNLSNAEKNITDVIRAAKRRLLGREVVAALEEAHGAASEGTTKAYLASLGRRNLLTNRRDVTPKGYGLPEWE